MTRDNFEVRITDQEDSDEYMQISNALKKFNSSYVKRDRRDLTISLFDNRKALAAGVLGVAPSINIPNFSEFRVGNSALGLHPADEKSPLTTGGQVAYWSVDNFDNTLEHFESHGGTVYRGPLEIEDGRYICQILDPFGNAIGLIGRRTNQK